MAITQLAYTFIAKLVIGYCILKKAVGKNNFGYTLIEDYCQVKTLIK